MSSFCSKKANANASCQKIKFLNGKNSSPSNFTLKALVPFTRTDFKVDFPTVCQPPSEPENGGYKCHPLPCHRLTQGTVIEYFCDEGYILKGGYQFRTCDNGEWKSPMQISCHPVQGTSHSSSSLIHKLGNLHILLFCRTWIVFLLIDRH